MTTCDTAAVHPTAQVAPGAIVGSEFRPLLDGRQLKAQRPTTIGARVWIGPYVTVGQGVTIGDDSILEEFARIQPNATIRQRVLVASRSHIGIGVTVGQDSVIKGHVGDNAQIGTGCRIAGDLIHRQLDPSVPWDDPLVEEPAAVIEDGVFIGWRALVVGGVNVGTSAYVCAGALVTKDVPAGHIAYGRNKIVHPSAWPGALGKSPFFQGPSDLCNSG